ncbi:MAG: hypothetical protein ACRCZ2_07875, partial [Fusobacteriaceae bacterium]
MNFKITKKDVINAQKYFRSLGDFSDEELDLEIKDLPPEKQELMISVQLLSAMAFVCANAFEKSLTFRKENEGKCEHFLELSKKIDTSENFYSQIGARIDLVGCKPLRVPGISMDALDLAFFFDDNSDEVSFGMAMEKKKLYGILGRVSIFEKGKNSASTEDFFNKITDFFIPIFEKASKVD